MTIETEVNKFWNRTDDFVRGLSHWRFASRWTDDIEWREMGMSSYEFLSLWLSEYYQDFSDLTIADYGCGGGAVAQFLCRDFKHVYGLDISASTLEECQKQVGNNFTPVLITIDNPEESLKIGKVDVFLSLATFQHFPSKNYGKRILKLAYDMTDRFALIQVCYDDGQSKYEVPIEDYSQNVFSLLPYRMSEFPSVCQGIGFQVLHSVRIPEFYYQYVFLKKESHV